MKLYSGALLVSAASAAVGKATLEATVANESGAGFNGRLNLYLGRNCNINVTTGRICDYRYLQSISALSQGKTYSFVLSQDVDPDNDQLLVTYRDKDEAIFSALKLSVNLGGSTRMIDLMNLDGGGDKYMAFDFDGRNHPCHSSYPRGTSCSFDNTFDFYSMKVKPHYSLLRGHVSKYYAIEEPMVPPRMDQTTYASSQLKLTTGNSIGDGTDDPISIYYGTNCDTNICQYNKIAQLTPKDRGTEYSIWMPDFDRTKDQLIMDYRSSDLLNIAKMSFEACTGASCQTFNLLSFGTSSVYKIAMDYDDPQEPCGERSYGDYVCNYDIVWDFKKMKKFTDNSVFVGQ